MNNELITKSAPLPLEVKKFKAGDFLFKQGEKGTTLYILQSGTVEVYIDDQLIEIINNQGSILGESSAIFKTKRSATIKFATDGEVISIPADYIDNIIISNPEIGLNLLKTVIERLHNANRQIVRLTKLVNKYKTELDKIKGKEEHNQEYKTGELFYQAGIITKSQLNEILKIQKELKSQGVFKPIGRILIEKGYATSFQVMQVMRLQKSLLKEKE